MFDYLIVYLYFIRKIKKIDSFLLANDYFLNHIKNLGVAGYTSAFVYMIDKGFDVTFIVLLLSGIIISIVAHILNKKIK
ncbi:hypothetical protein GCM10007932_04360 [Vibrio penaeicida]|uniref:Uncharacterized protein n=1 Tax=Vibrio penaeicida TaxID=104609 RepID=A0AAV5NKC7_9VIBR|nr:hypothetical protein GCM10007932_04360 [Vibrio penaeicida]